MPRLSLNRVGSMAVILGMLAGPSRGQVHTGVPYRVQDLPLRGISTPPRLWTDQGLFASAGDKAVFVAEGTWAIGRELWVSDGTEEGTHLLKDLDPRLGRDLSLSAVLPFVDGGTSKAAYLGSNELGVVVVVTDGTEEGTVVSEPAPTSSWRFVGTHRGRPMFIGDTVATSQLSLWIVDGTTPRRLTGWNGNVAFYATQFVGEAGGLSYFWRKRYGDGAWELCRTDGTPEGTWAIPGLPGNYATTPLAALSGDQVFLTAFVDGTVTRAYVTGGTAESTRELAIPAGTTLSSGSALAPLPSGVGVLIGANQGSAIVVSDGTDAGTTTFLTGVGIQDSTSMSPARIESPHGPVTIFWGRTNATGVELWVTDGTPAGTRLLTDAYPGSGSSQFLVLGRAANQIVFGSGSVLDYRTFDIWTTDGTPEGTRRLSFDSSARQASIPGPFRALAGGRLLFRPNTSNSADLGLLWSVDPRTAEHALVEPGPGLPRVAGANAGPPVSMGGTTVYSVPASAGGSLLIETDGTSTGTAAVTPSIFPSVGALSRVGPLAWFTFLNADNLNEFWRTDGTQAGTFPAGSSPHSVVTTPGPFLAGGDGVVVYNEGIYTSNGAPGSVRRLSQAARTSAGDLGVDSAGIVYHGVLRSGSLMDITAVDPATGVSTVLATNRVTSTTHLNFHAAGRRMYFTLSVSQLGYRLWRTDGTPEGTADVDGLPNQQALSILAAAGEKLLFLRGAGDQVELAVVGDDGPVTGLRVFRAAEAICEFGDRAVLLADDGEHGVEPWISDGTPEGTTMITETVPGRWGATVWGRDGVPISNAITNTPTLVAGERRCYFSVSDPALASHAWMTDGTAEGTRPLGRLPDELSRLPLAPIDFAETDGVVYFRGWTLERGLDLYAVRLCDADFTGDGFLDFFDYLGFADAFAAGTPDADVNGDGFVDFFDYGSFVEAFERGC